MSSKYFIVIFLVCCLSVLGIVVFSYQRHLETLIDQEKQSMQVLELAEELQNSFDLQVHEWKNILLRGSDPMDKSKYYKAFLKNTNIVSETLKQISHRTESLHKDYDVHARLIQEIQQAHQYLNNQYAKALEILDDGSYDKQQLADASVRNADRALGNLLIELEEHIESSNKALFERNFAQIKNLNIIIAISVLFILLASFFMLGSNRMLYRTKKMLETILAHSAQGVMIYQKGAVAYTSKVYEQILGHDFKGASHEKLMSFVHPDDRQRVQKLQFQARDQKQKHLSYTCRAIRKDGKTITIEDNIIVDYDARGKIDQAYILTRDITAETKRESQLREVQERYNTLLQISDHMVFVKNADFAYIIANQNLADYFGLPISQVLGKSDFDLFGHSDAKACRARDTFALGQNSKVHSKETIDGKLFDSTIYTIELAGETCIVGILKECS